MLSLIFIFGLNIYCCTELVEGIIERTPFKIWPWILFNGVVLVFVVVYVITVDTFMGFLIHVFFSNGWMAIVMIWIKIIQENKEKSPLIKADNVNWCI